MEKDEQLFNAISELIKNRNQYAKQALSGFWYKITEIIRTKSQNENRIEHLSDNLFDYYFNVEVLEEFKRLLRYYLPMNTRSVESHINWYRDCGMMTLIKMKSKVILK